MKKPKPPTPAKLKKLFDYNTETGALTWKYRPEHRKERNTRHAGKPAGSLNGCGYWCVEIAGRKFPSHRVAWCLVYGKWPSKEIDHINRNRADNRLVNLRLATRKENSRNNSLSPKNTSGHMGVSLFRPSKKWKAAIRIHGRDIHLGLFADIKDAIAARKAGEAKYFGEFAPQ